MARYLVMIDGREFDVKIESALERVQGHENYVAEVNGTRSNVRSQILGQSRSLLFVDGEVDEIDVRQDSEPNNRVLFIRGMEINATVEEYHIGRLRRLVSTSGNSSSQSKLLAPMPGLIVSVDVQPGDSVVTGQQLVLIEAMKMENVIKAKSSGVLKSVQVVAGKTVDKGEILMEFE